MTQSEAKAYARRIAGNVLVLGTSIAEVGDSQGELACRDGNADKEALTWPR